MQASTGARRSILLSLAVLAAGAAAAAYHFPRQQAYAAEAQRRARVAQVPRVEVMVNGEHVIDGMAVDTRGTLYVTLHNQDNVYVMSQAGRPIRFTDRDQQENDPSRRRSLSSPQALGSDALGKLYTVDSSGPASGCFVSSRIKQISGDGKVAALAHADTAMAPIVVPSNIGLAVDRSGDLYMQEWNATYKVSRTGTLLPLALPDDIGRSVDKLRERIAAHPDGGIIVANGRKGLYRIFPDGHAVRLDTHGADCWLGMEAPPAATDYSACGADPDGSCAQRMRAAQPVQCEIDAVAVDAGGRIFLSENARILQVDTDGTVSTFFDAAKGIPLSLKNPVHYGIQATLAPGPHGEMYWAQFSTLYKITPWSRAPRL